MLELCRQRTCQLIFLGSTHRGPVISDHGMTIAPNQVVSLRWSVPEFVGNETGNRDLLLAKNLQQAVEAIGKMATPLNYIVADYQGNIARVASGYVPKRKTGNGLLPQRVGAEDNWDGRIPAAEMPMEINPERDWSGTANHDILPDDYPYAYSTHFSPSWRYRRLIELFEQPQVDTADHWRFLMDNKNMMAEVLWTLD